MKQNKNKICLKWQLWKQKATFHKHSISDTKMWQLFFKENLKDSLHIFHTLNTPRCSNTALLHLLQNIRIIFSQWLLCSEHQVISYLFIFSFLTLNKHLYFVFLFFVGIFVVKRWSSRQGFFFLIKCIYFMCHFHSL